MSTAAGNVDDELITERWLRPMIVVAIGMFMSLLDVTIVNVAVPAIQRDFGGALEDVLWIATAYTLTLGVVVPLTSWLGDRFGLTRLYVGAVIAFALCSGLCGLAGNLGFLIVARILQAVPGGILPVVCVALVYRIVPKDKISPAMGIIGIAFVVAPAVGPVVGGYLVEYVDWRLVFYMNLPVGFLTAIATFLWVPKVPPARAARFDIAGFVTIAAGLAAILLAASKGEEWGWDSYRILMLIVGGLLCLALFVVIELQVDDPLLNLRLFRNGYFTIGLVIMALLTVNLLASSFYLPVFLQQGQGMEAFDAGLRVFPQALAMCVATASAGALYDRLGPRLLCTVGATLCTWGNLLLCALSADLTYSQLVIWSSVRGFGMSLTAIGCLTAGVNCVRPSQTNQASAFQNLMQQVVGAFGLAVLGTMLVSQQAQLLADRAALLHPGSELARIATPALSEPGPMRAETFAMVFQAGSRLQLDVMARGLDNIFLVLAATTLVCVALALLFPRQQPPLTETDPEPTLLTRDVPAGRAADAATTGSRTRPTTGMPEREVVPV